MNRFIYLILFFILLVCAPLAHAAPPAGFQSTQIIGSGLTNPTGFDIAPDGRIFILQQKGEVRIYKNGQLLPTPFVTLPTSQAGGDLGLLGIAFDPNFASNHYVYFYYTSTGAHNTIVRLDATGDVAPNSPAIIYESNDITQQFHAGGTIQFGNDGKLYLSVGDNGYPPNAQNLNNTLGKILRINKDGTIPSDNPFVGQSGKLPEIWAYGLRNPFRFQFDKATGKLYLGDVGELTWEEVNVIIKGANYGWPTCEGTCGTSGMTNPLYAYNHNGLSSSISGGLVYRGATFPSSYVGSYFFGDYARGFIRRVVLDANGNFVSASDFDTSVGTVVDMRQAADGSIYYLTIFPGRLYQITYGTGNQVPVAVSSANVTTGNSPLTVNFSSAGSNDPDGTPITYAWNFGDGTTSTAANPTKVYSANGQFTVNLTVSDGVLQAQAAPITIQVGTPPSLTITSPVNNSSYQAGNVISYSSTATNGNGQSLPDSAFTTEIIFHHSTHTHPFSGVLPATRTGQFTIPTTGETATDVFYEIKITATDTNGLSQTRSVQVNPIVVNLNFVTNPTNFSVFVDSQVVSTPQTVQSVAGMKREVNVSPMQLLSGTYYQFDSWSDGGALKHLLTTPGTNATITANLKTTPPFSATYYNNVNLTGSPVLTRNEGMVDYDFQGGSPHPSVNSDNFSARWVKQHYFQVGSYKFDTVSDDGVRLFIDGVALIDKWVDQGSTPYSGTINLTEGNHEIKFEYYERGGGANVRLVWDMISPDSPPPPPAGQSIASFTLINADSDFVVAGYDPIPSGASLNLATLPTRNLNIRANTNPATVGSVRFGYDGNSNFGTENNAPYALASDNGGNYLPWTPTVGSHSVTATPYTNSNAGGTVGTPLTLAFTVTDQGTPPPPTGQSITSFSLINADTDQVIVGYDQLTPNININLQTLPTRNLNIRANTNPATVGSVRFGYDGNSNFGTENNAPYALASDNGGNYLPWTPTVGSHSVTATPYASANASGTVGTPSTLPFTVSDQGSPPPPPPAGISVTSLVLINADNDQIIQAFNPLTNNATLSLSALPTRNLNIIANTNPEFIGSVRFGYDGNTNFQTENILPYAFSGDDGGDYFGWTPTAGSHTITATPYPSQNAGGTAGTAITITINVTN